MSVSEPWTGRDPERELRELLTVPIGQFPKSPCLRDKDCYPPQYLVEGDGGTTENQSLQL